MIEKGNAQIKQVASEFTQSWEERWQSLRAGLVSAGATSLVVCGMIGSRQWLPRLWPVLLPVQPLELTDGFLLGAIAQLSGFLFGVTYRYIVRQDNNPHLKAGAVGAFSLVRGLAQIEACGSGASISLWLLFLLESFALFLGARLALDRAINGGWVKPYPSVLSPKPDS